jgi:DNA-binding response OmpR family regulator
MVDAPPAAEFVSGVTPLQSWSVLDAVDAIVAFAMAHAEPSDMPVEMGITLAEQLRELTERLPVLVPSRHPEAACKIGGRGRAAAAREPFAAEDLVARADSLAH